MNKIVFPFLLAVTLVLANSCAPTTRASYLSKNNKSDFSEIPDEVYYTDKELPDTIHINDELYISVTTSDDSPNSFDQTGGGMGSNIGLISFLVDEDGYIKLPYIKRLLIEGMTINQAVDTLEKQLSEYIYFPSVTLKIINHRFSVLGEVNSPGLYTFNQKSINIFQAIATANDITIYGNRTNILIVRQNGNRITKKYIDLLDENIITSQWYIIQPDDLIFVEPLGRKAFGMETIPYDLIFSIFSSTILIFSFMLNLYM